MTRRKKKSDGGKLLADLISLVFGVVLLLAKVVIQLLLLPFRLLTSGGKGKPEQVVGDAAPKFKDFRYSGGTYEESLANYERAYEEWKKAHG